MREKADGKEKGNREEKSRICRVEYKEQSRRGKKRQKRAGKAEEEGKTEEEEKSRRGRKRQNR